MRDDILQVRAPALCFYVLRDSTGLYLIDGGFIGGPYLLARALVVEAGIANQSGESS